MSVWPGFPPERPLALLGSEGELVSISVTVEPRDLEELLEALAALDFPINPQIYHDATTLVGFPAYEDRLPEIRSLLEAYGFPPGLVQTTGMLDSIRCGHAAVAGHG